MITHETHEIILSNDIIIPIGLKAAGIIYRPDSRSRPDNYSLSNNVHAIFCVGNGQRTTPARHFPHGITRKNAVSANPADMPDTYTPLWLAVRLDYSPFFCVLPQSWSWS